MSKKLYKERKAKDLYNGNIRDMYTAIMKDDETPLGTYNYQYQYDQLNRIKAMNSQGLSLSGSTIIPVAGLYETSYNYDRNGNLTGLQRWADNGTTKTAMDEFTYDYIDGTNKLALVHDAVNAGNFADDLDDQVAGLSALSFPTYDLQDEATHNYRYDAIGQLIQDKTEEIENIAWTVTGKVKKIERYAFSEKPDLAFDYDPMGQRITKTVYPKSAPGVIDVDGVTKTYYVYDSQGNVMIVYTLKTEEAEKNLYLSERMLYGSTRLGMEQVNQIVASTEPTNIDINTAQQRVVGDKRYEMQNHLNSVMVTVTDRKLPEYNATENLAYYKPDVVSYSDFLPFGKLSPNRHGGEMGRIGFQGQEQVPELKGEGRDIHFTYRDYDPDIGRMKSVDPLSAEYAHNSPYAFSENRVIDGIELEGLEYISSEDSRIELKEGKVLLKIENFIWINRRRFINREQNGPWKPWEIGTSREIGNLRLITQTDLDVNNDQNHNKESALDNQIGAPNPSYNPSVHTWTNPTTKSGRTDLRYKTRFTSGAGPGLKGGSIAALAINFLNFATENYFYYAAVWDEGLVDDHVVLLEKAFEDVKKAIYEGLIPVRYLNENDISTITNVVFNGENHSDNQQLFEIGMYIYDAISQPMDLLKSHSNTEDIPPALLRDNTKVNQSTSTLKKEAIDK